MGHSERFWLEDPNELLSNFEVFPSQDHTWEQKLNAVTRLIIVITIVLIVLKWESWLTFLLISLVLIIFVYLLKNKSSKTCHSPKLMTEHFNEGKQFKYYTNTTTKIAAPVTYFSEVPEEHPKMEMKLRRKKSRKNASLLSKEAQIAVAEDHPIPTRSNMLWGLV